MIDKPIIGITAYPNGEGHGYHTPYLYVQCVLKAGGVPILFPPIGMDTVPHWLSIVHGIVLVGGGDIEPSRFTDKNHETIYNLNPVRDETELEIARLAIEKKIPMLGICRGLQIINTLLGGTLHLHLPDVVSGNVDHRVPPRDPTMHPVRVKTDSNLAKIMQNDRVNISSWHHQAIENLGKGVIPIAWAEDEVIEAIEIENNPQITAVQWHPEITALEDKSQLRLFENLITQAKGK
jgi:putative glutamine amidotransferase